MDKTMILAKDPTTRHVYERAQHFLQNDPDLQTIVNDFTPEMFTVQVIEVLGTPLDTDVYVRDFVTQNCIKIIRDVEKFEPLTDGFTNFQMIQKNMNTYTVYECKYQLIVSGTILIDTTRSCRRGYRKHYPQERYSRFIPVLGQG